MKKRFLRVFLGLICVPFLPILMIINFIVWIAIDYSILLRIVDFVLKGE